MALSALEKREVDAWAVRKGETETIAIFTLLQLRAPHECDADG